MLKFLSHTLGHSLLVRGIDLPIPPARRAYRLWSSASRRRYEYKPTNQILLTAILDLWLKTTNHGANESNS